MGRYIVRRVLWGILLMLLVSLLTFVMFNVLPSADPAVLRAGRNGSPAEIAYIRHSLGLDKPLYVQYYRYIKGIVLHGDFGFSYYSQQPVITLIKDRLPATISLTVGGAIVWLLSGILVGIISAIKRGTVIDRTAMGLALVFVSMPVFWLGLILLFLVSNDLGRFHIFPGAGSYVGLTTDPVNWFTSLILPWFVLASTSAAVYSRLLRGSLLEVMSEDYIRTARAKGLSERRVILRHGVRSAITPIVTVFGLDVGLLLGGAVIVESVFSIHGVGLLNLNAINDGDFPIVQGTVLLAAFFIVLANIVVDIAYAYVDPRVRYS